MRPLALLLTSMVLLQACDLTVVGPPVVVPPPIPVANLTSCHAVGLEGLIGQPVTLIPRAGAWSTLRIIRPGELITTDYSATRLNARIGTDGRILSLYCG
ncbi:MAG: I78 family peptidase inhibitor [Paracoccaceae bacterium]